MIMIKTSIELLAEPIGFDIANSDDVVQSSLFNGLGRGFNLYNPDQRNMQICYLASKLNSKADKLVLELAEYIKLKQK